jgi:hypothetical protein
VAGSFRILTDSSKVSAVGKIVYGPVAADLSGAGARTLPCRVHGNIIVKQMHGSPSIAAVALKSLKTRVKLNA